jgi:hypothetical protein
MFRRTRSRRTTPSFRQTQRRTKERSPHLLSKGITGRAIFECGNRSTFHKSHQFSEGEQCTARLRDNKGPNDPCTDGWWLRCVRLPVRDERNVQFNHHSQVKEAGFSSAFLSHSDFAGSDTDYFHLPRISMPNRPMSHVEFCARVAGAGVLYRNLKHAVPLTGHTMRSLSMT